MSIIPFPHQPPAEVSLELLEQTCLNYLGEAKVPLVPVENLLAFVQRTVGLQGVSKSSLLEFLRNHDEIDVLESADPGDDVSGDLLHAAGMIMGPRALLKARMPTQRELYAQVAVQLQSMRDTLGQALAHADADAALAGKRPALENALERVDELMQRLSALLR